MASVVLLIVCAESDRSAGAVVSKARKDDEEAFREGNGQGPRPLVNLRGIADSARALVVPTVVVIAGIGAVILWGLLRSHPAHTIGRSMPVHVSEAVGVILILKAFAANCSALTGVEAIANAVPIFREPKVRNAQRTELLLGLLVGSMLLGLAVLIHRFHVVPREGVTMLAQLTAGAVGGGVLFKAIGLSVTVVLVLAANTSFGCLPVLMSLLARDNRMPDLFGLRAEGRVYRYGLGALALAAGRLSIAVGSDTQRLVPLFARILHRFTITQTGLVRRWATTRPSGWQFRKRSCQRASRRLAGLGSRSAAGCAAEPAAEPGRADHR